ncbi:hypothetical protein [Alteromonas sp. OM2203]|uniref:hypothetical protein n=1 Tax=Alteromonas sp. OM2203 TaxID=3398817 RepID=UPI003AF3C3D4
MAYNKQIKSLAAARWDANTWAASPFSPTRLRPLFGSYVHMRIQTLSLLLLLNGCSSIDNKIGYGVNFEIPIEASCLISTINEYEPFQPVIALDSSLEFTYLENNTSLSLHSKNLIGGYQLTIDGMFLGKSHQQFVQEAEQTSKLVKRLVNQGCS